MKDLNKSLIFLILTILLSQTMIIYLLFDELRSIHQVLDALNNGGIFIRHHHDSIDPSLLKKLSIGALFLVAAIKGKVFETVSGFSNILFTRFVWEIVTINFRFFLALPFTEFPGKNTQILFSRKKESINSQANNLYFLLLFRAMRETFRAGIFNGNTALFGSTLSQFNEKNINIQNFVIQLSSLVFITLPQKYHPEVQSRTNYWKNIFGIEGNKEHVFIVQTSYLALMIDCPMETKKLAIETLINLLVRNYGIDFSNLKTEQLKTISRGIEFLCGIEIDSKLNQIAETAEDKSKIRENWMKEIHSELKIYHKSKVE